MTTIDILQRLLLALSIGLLIGVERGWQERAGREGSRAAGVRTFALIGLAGGVAALLSEIATPLFLGFAAVAFVAALLPFEWREAAAADSASATGMIAGLVTFFLGAYAVHGSMAAAAAGGIATTIILAERKVLHEFVSRVTWVELRAALLLLTMTFVLLPLLPDRTVDPWNALNPRQLWLMMVVIAAVSSVGYLCVRLLGARAGLLAAAAAGGLVSSTAVTLAYARLSEKQPNSVLPLASGIAAAWAMSLMRMSGIAVALAPALLRPLSLVLGPPVLVLALFASVFYRRAGQQTDTAPLALDAPFELGEVVKFGVLLAGVTLIAKLANLSGLPGGLVPLAAASGLVDVDPITLSAARMAGGAISFPFAATLILVAGGANVVCKTAVALAIGSRALFVDVAMFAAAAGAAAGAAWALSG